MSLPQIGTLGSGANDASDRGCLFPRPVVTAGNGAIGQGNMAAGDAAHVAVALVFLKHDALDA